MHDALIAKADRLARELDLLVFALETAEGEGGSEEITRLHARLERLRDMALDLAEQMAAS